MTATTPVDAVDTAAMMAHLNEFARRVKLSGTPEELESFHYLRDTLQSYGLQTDLISHDAYISLPGKARLLIGNDSPDCITHSFSRPSGPQGVRARIVYAGAGTPADFARVDAKDAIALLDGIANPAASLNASRAGALGQIHVCPREHIHEMCISSIWGSPTPDQLDTLPKTTVLSVRRADGDAIKARLAAGEPVEATLFSEVDTGWRQTPILEARLAPESPANDDFVLFSGHHDTWYFGVMDNGTANAVMLEVARIFAQHRATLRRGLRLCFWSGHSHGRYSGSAWYADTRFDELARNCVAHVNVDSVGARGNTVLADALSSHELFALADDAVQAQGGQSLDGHRMSRAGDQSFWGIGIPSVFMGMGEQPADGGESVMGPAVGGGGARKGAGFGWWWHTPHDTLDKIDPELLLRDTRIYVHAVGRLLSDPVLPIDVARQAHALHRELSTLSTQLGPRADLAPLLARAAALEALAARPPAEPEAANRALVAACRALVPMDYTSGDRFSPDPALKQNPYPVLDPVRALAATEPGSDAARFAAVASRRALNRLSTALHDAAAALA